MGNDIFPPGQGPGEGFPPGGNLPNIYPGSPGFGPPPGGRKIAGPKPVGVFKMILGTLFLPHKTWSDVRFQGSAEKTGWVLAVLLAAEAAAFHFRVLPTLHAWKVPLPLSDIRLGDLDPGMLTVVWAVHVAFCAVLAPFLIHLASDFSGGHGPFGSLWKGAATVTVLFAPAAVALGFWPDPLPFARLHGFYGLGAWIALLLLLQVKALYDFSATRALFALILGTGLVGAGYAGMAFAGKGWAGTYLVTDFESRLAGAGRAPAAQPGADPENNAAGAYREIAATDLQLDAEQRAAIDALIERGWNDPRKRWFEVLRKRAVVTEALRAAAARSYCDFTAGAVAQILPDTPAPFPAAGLFDAARLAALEGRLQESRGLFDDAMGNYLAILGVARHLGAQRNFILEARAAREPFLALALARIEDLYRRRKVSSKANAKVRDLLAALFAEEVPLADGFREELEETRGAADDLMRRILRPLRPRLRDQLLREHAELEEEYIRVLVRAAGAGGPEDEAAFLDKLAADTADIHRGQPQESWENCILYPRRFAKCFFASPPRERARYAWRIAVERVIEARLRVLQTASILAWFVAERGESPEEADDVVPLFVKRLPPDPFSDGAAVKIGKAGARGWTAYSIGPDRKDDRARQAFDPTVVGARDWDWSRPGPGDVMLRNY